MTFFIIKRLLYLIPILFAVALVGFLLMHLTPGDPAKIMLGVDATQEEIDALHHELGLDLPLHMQFVEFLKGYVTGHLGISYYHKEEVTTLFMQRFPATLELSAAALIIGSAVAIPLGTISATMRYSIVDHVSVVFALAGLSVPVFWLGIMLMYFFSLQLGWFPMTGIGGGLFTLDGLRHLVLPGVTLSTGILASNTRLVRASLLEVLQQPYVKTARAKGLHERVVIIKHALRNALIPVVTNMGLQIGVLLGGSFLTETIFAWPGVGRLAVDAIFRRDFPVIQGVTILIASFFVIVNLLIDIIYTFLDPRIKYS